MVISTEAKKMVLNLFQDLDSNPLYDLKDNEGHEFNVVDPDRLIALTISLLIFASETLSLTGYNST
jgi:hypothetical protein